MRIRAVDAASQLCGGEMQIATERALEALEAVSWHMHLPVIVHEGYDHMHPAKFHRCACSWLCALHTG